MLLLPDAAACAREIGAAEGMAGAELFRDGSLRERIVAALEAHNQACGGATSRAVVTAVLLDEPASIRRLYSR